MKQYHIHHAIKPTFDETEVQLRKYVGFVNAISLNEAFIKSQNHDIDWAKNETRSTSIGDVIQDDDKLYLVLKVGFKELTAITEPEPEPIRQPYVFKYLRKSDNTLIGYHLDSFCSTGPKEHAKVYNCTSESLSKQLEIITKNLKYLLGDDDENKSKEGIGLFRELIPKNNKFMKGLKFDEILLIPELVS